MISKSSTGAASLGGVWLARFTLLTALATLGLVGMGGLVTSKGVGMSVPDWPTSYGYNMFALPINTWFTGGIFDEHTHRLWATLVGVMVVASTRWLGGRESRFALVIIGAVELLLGVMLLFLGVKWHGAGHFLLGIGGVVLLAGIVWTRNQAARGNLPWLGWLAFWLVQVQGLLGGLRVVLDSYAISDLRLGTIFGILHGCLGQGFLVLTACIALLTSRWWQRSPALNLSPMLRRWFLGAWLLVFLQLLVGATMRHQHAGLAISDFPLAHGKFWPDLSATAIAKYNSQRIEVTVGEPITAFQIELQMLHRLLAVAILFAVACCYAKTPSGSPGRRLAGLWLGLVCGQSALGAWTIWSNKAADIATLHVLGGALSLVTGALVSIICFRRLAGDESPKAIGITESANVTVSA